MRYWLTALTMVAAMLLQATIAPQLAIAGIRPNLPLLLVVAIGACQGPWLGLLAGALVGALQDVMLGRFIGLFTLAWGAVGLLVGLLERRVFREHVANQFSLALTGTAVAELICYVLISAFSLHTPFLGSLRTILASAVYNAALAPLIFPLVLRVSAFLRARDQQA